MMPGQATFDGFAPARPTDRLFLAVRPDAPAATRIVSLAQSLRREHGLRGQPLPAAQLHVTLQFFGDHAGIPGGLLAAIERAVACVDLRAFQVVFDHVASFDGRSRHRPWVLRGSATGLAPLCSLHRVLGAQSNAAGVRVHGHARFLPHLTMLYDDRALPPQAIDPIGWSVRELLLIDSLVGQGEHRILQRWPLPSTDAGRGSDES